VSELVDARETLDEIRSGMSRRMQIDFDSNYNVWSQAVEACAHLDCLISLSYTCEEEVSCRPTFLPGDQEEAQIEVSAPPSPRLPDGCRSCGTVAIRASAPWRDRLSSPTMLCSEQ